MSALVAIEAVVGSVDVDLLAALLRGELSYAFDRDHAVALAEVGHHRTARHEVRVVEHAAAVVRHRAGDPRQLRRRHPREESAPAIADDADLACGRGGLHRRLDVEQGGSGGDPRSSSPWPAVTMAGGYNPRSKFFFPPAKNPKPDRDVAVCGVAVGHRPDMAVHAEDLLHHDNGAARIARGIGAVGVEFVAGCSNELDHV